MAKSTQYLKRKELVEQYNQVHNNRELYQEVKDDLNLSVKARQAIEYIVMRIQQATPYRTGWARAMATRYSKNEDSVWSISAEVYDITIGQEGYASNGQLANAPYAAILNYDPRTRWWGWLDPALRSAVATVRNQYRLRIFYKIDDQFGLYPSGGTAGIRITIGFN